MKRLPAFSEIENKIEVRGSEYRDGEWTGRYFQPMLLCKHVRLALKEAGWVIEETSRFFPRLQLERSSDLFIPEQKCEHARA